MLPYKKNNENNFTAIFFKNQNIESLIDAIKKLSQLKINSTFIRNNAKKFDDIIFIKKLQDYVNNEFKISKN